MLALTLFLNLILSLNPINAFLPVSEPFYITATARFDQPVLGEICIEAEATSDDADIFFYSKCEGINGKVRQLRIRWPWVGEFKVRAIFRGGADSLVTNYQRLVVKPPIGRY